MGLLNLRNALMAGKRLPYDAEVEYLQSSGTQYINTNIKPGPNTRAEIVFAMTTFTANCGLFGARDASNANLFYNLFIINNSGHRVRWDWCGKGDYKTSEAETSTVATYVLGAAGSYITRDGVSLMSVSSTKTALNQPLYIFNFNNNGSPYSTGANARFWSVKIYEGQTLVFDGIPVRKGTVGYLYDRVSGKLFGNAGTGDFVVGQDVVPVEYIKSHGTEYIKPDITVATNDSFALNIMGAFTGASSAMQLHGVNGGAYFGVGTNDNITVGGLDTNVPRDSVKHRWEMSATIGNSKTVSLNLDGATYSRTRNNAEGHISLFALVFASGGSPTYFCKFKMDTATIYKNGDLARKLLPVRVGTDATSWEGAMMDVLTRRIYRNAGTGAFGYGNDLKYPIPAS